MSPTPEENARQTIDTLLDQAGWIVQDRDQADIESALLPLPPMNEQRRISKALAEVESSVERIEGVVGPSVVHGSRMRRATLASAFSGKLIPQDPTDELASALLERIRAERAAKPKQSAQPKREEPCYA